MLWGDYMGAPMRGAQPIRLRVCLHIDAAVNHRNEMSVSYEIQHVPGDRAINTAEYQVAV